MAALEIEKEEQDAIVAFAMGWIGVWSLKGKNRRIGGVTYETYGNDDRSVLWPYCLTALLPQV